MVVSVGEVPEGADNGATSPARPGPAGRTRRDVVRGLYACALTAALASASAAFRPVQRPGPGDPSGDPAFDTAYRGHRIRGVWVPARGTAEDGRWHVTVDGRPLHLMRRADGTWLSMLDHYCSYRTPLEAARAAVDELGPGERLREPPPGPGEWTDPHRGQRHGVRA